MTHQVDPTRPLIINIPYRIQPGEGFDRRWEGFPHNLLYTTVIPPLPVGLTAGALAWICAKSFGDLLNDLWLTHCIRAAWYFPDADSFVETGQFRRLIYRPLLPAPYYVEVSYEKPTDWLVIAKYRKGQSVGETHAPADDFAGAMTLASLAGCAPDEAPPDWIAQLLPLSSHYLLEVAEVGVWIPAQPSAEPGRRPRPEDPGGDLFPGLWITAGLSEQAPAPPGGRESLPEVLWPYAGRRPDGLPRGLVRCPLCGEPRGWCLDPDPDRWGSGLFKISCRCAVSLCEKCGRPYGPHQPISDFYDERTDRIIHVPWFAGLSHRCHPENQQPGGNREEAERSGEPEESQSDADRGADSVPAEAEPRDRPRKWILWVPMRWIKGKGSDPSSRRRQ
jgi:hypothetical protein